MTLIPVTFCPHAVDLTLRNCQICENAKDNELKLLRDTVSKAADHLKKNADEIGQKQRIVDAAVESYFFNGYHKGDCFCANCALRLELQRAKLIEPQKDWCPSCELDHAPDCEVHHHLMGDGRCSCLPPYKRAETTKGSGNG